MIVKRDICCIWFSCLVLITIFFRKPNTLGLWLKIIISVGPGPRPVCECCPRSFSTILTSTSPELFRAIFATTRWSASWKKKHSKLEDTSCTQDPSLGLDYMHFGARTNWCLSLIKSHLWSDRIMFLSPPVLMHGVLLACCCCNCFSREHNQVFGRVLCLCPLWKLALFLDSISCLSLILSFLL